MKNYKYIIIGGGAAGLYLGTLLDDCLILERNARVGSKVLASGGGYCNFTNTRLGPQNYVSQNPDFVRPILDAFPVDVFFDFLKKHMLTWQEKDNGRLFLNEGGGRLVAAFEKDMRATIKTGYQVTKIATGQDGFVVNDEFVAEKVIVATGGVSAGGTDFGLTLARQFGHTVIAPSPGLVRFDLNDLALSDLSGVSVQNARWGQFKDGIVFTKKGIGGPLIYQISLYHKAGTPITIDLSQCDHIPKRLRRILEGRKEIVFTPTKTAGFRFAEVMQGGVNTQEVDPITLMSCRQKGLYFAGEVLDVTGNLGGYNLHFAFACAYVLAQSMASTPKD